MDSTPPLPGSELVWLDGEFVLRRDIGVNLLAHSLHYGLGVFEGMRCYTLPNEQRIIFRLRDHIHRLFRSARICNLKIPYSQEELCVACVELLGKTAGESLYIRPLVFLGEGSMGLDPSSNRLHTAISIWEFGPYLGADGLAHGIRAHISSCCRGPCHSIWTKAKITGHYALLSLAKQEAVALGFDEAILLDSDGYVAEATAQNVFAVLDGQIWTPPASSPLLPGLTRDSVITLARDFGYTIFEARFGLDSLWTADEAFLTSTASEVTPIREVNGRTIGDGLPGPVTLSLQGAFFAAVKGQDKRHTSWLSLA
jgi:branched-chain amino acid aminotransferase